MSWVAQLQAELLSRALRCAALNAAWCLGLVQNFNRGVRYVWIDSIALSEAREELINRSFRGKPYNKAMAEWFLKAPKGECVYRNNYREICRRLPFDRAFLSPAHNHK